MTKTFALTLLLGATIAVSACSGSGMYEQEPYRGRTAGDAPVVTQTQPVVRSAEPVFRARQVK